MLDVGNSGRAPVRPAESLNGLKQHLEDPANYFLGPRFESLILPDHGAEYYGFPPSKLHVFREHRSFRQQSKGFAPLVSFAGGGLAEVWTGGCYPFNDEELAQFPFGYSELGPFYGEVARRIGLSGTIDDLTQFFPVHDGIMDPLTLDAHSERLLSSYRANSGYFNGKLSTYLGRARVAAISRDHAGRKACDYSGRCLWGCPQEAFYTPAITLRECRTWPTFEYHSGLYVDHFRADAGGKIGSVVAHDAAGSEHEFPVGRLVLAAGTLCSTGIFLESIRRDTGKSPELGGLMDNRQVLMPFVNLGMLGKQFQAESYQYHQVAIGVRPPVALDYVHGLVTTLKTALIHPLVQNLPFDLGTSAAVFRNLHAALGLVNINCSDYRRPENRITLEQSSQGRRLLIQYQPAADEPERLKGIQAHFRKLLWKLGCFAPPPMTHVRPMGASVHYAGVLPMSTTVAPWTCTRECRSNDFENLYFVDGTTFPFLPAKNLTFTLMANAARVAEQAF
jgi:choline dehydrogenase-like flavoprotein